MAEGAGKFCPRRSVAAIAQIRLGLDQQCAFFLGMVRAVTIQTANIIAGMHGGAEVTLAFSFAMTLEAAPACFRARQFRKTHDLRFVASARHVLRARTMAGFASVAVSVRGLNMGSVGEMLLVYLLVAAHADVGTGVLRRIGSFAWRMLLGRERGQREQ